MKQTYKHVFQLVVLGSVFLLTGTCLMTSCEQKANVSDETDTQEETSKIMESDSSEEKTDSVADKQTDTATDAETILQEEPALNIFPTEGHNIEIGIFYEPPVSLEEAENYNPEEQYDWIRDANITFVEMTNGKAHPNLEAEEYIRDMCEARGIKVSWMPGNDGANLLRMSDAQLQAYFADLKQNESIVGVHIVDEPAQPWVYSRVCAACTDAGLTPRLNFLPSFATWVFENYQGHIEDTIIATTSEKYGYLSYDQYPFPYGKGQPTAMYANLNLVREIGLKHDVKTAFYIQSIGEHGNFRRTNENEIRYHISAGLAYGIKSYTYFTWWTTGFCDPVDYAIISPYGEKTDIYDGVTQVNADVLKVGKLLYQLDALEVYHYGSRDSGTVELKASMNPPIIPTSKKFIVSFMQDRNTGRDYIMLVNKSYTSEVTVDFTIRNDITHLYNCTEGVYDELDISNGTVTLTFKKGGFILLAVGQHDNIVDKTWDLSANLAEGKRVFCNRVNPGAGWYAYCITDGKRDGSDTVAKGYKCSEENAIIGIDLGRVTEINRVDIYPSGTSYNLGMNFPTCYTVEISKNGADWVVIATETDYTGARDTIPTYSFDKQPARYIRLNVTAGMGKGFEIAEIEVYCDEGNIPQADNSNYKKVGNEPAGTDVADGRPVTCSSEFSSWPAQNITLHDGLWSSALSRNPKADSVEWVCVDLIQSYDIDKIILKPRSDDTYFPEIIEIQVSDDGEYFTTVYTLNSPERENGTREIEISLDTAGRYVRLYATKLREHGGGDGYLFQLDRLNVINK